MVNVEHYIKKSDKRIEKIDLMQKLRSNVSNEAPLVISFAGKFKTGKSSLINAVLGYDLLPTKATTATAVVTRIVKGNELKAWLLKDGKKENISIEKAKDTILNYEVNDIEHLVEVIFEVPVSWLSPEIELRDTPGMDDSSQNGVLEKVTMKSLIDTDICICVYDASSLLSGKERERTEKIHKMLNGNLVYAVNCINRLNSQENYLLVEERAKSFFKTMSYSLPEMGRQFMISSAPGNLLMNGFDEWFIFFVSKKNDLDWNIYRSASEEGQLKALAERFFLENDQDLRELNSELTNIKEKHDLILQEKMKKEHQKGKEASDYVKYEAEPEAEKIFVTDFGLEKRLSDIYKNTEKMNMYPSYQKMCSAETVLFFKEKYRLVCEQFEGIYDTESSSFIETAISKICFPDKHKSNVSSTTGERVAGATVGAIIGAFFTPIGALIGGAIGSVIGGADSIVDDSVSNTAKFVHNTVLPIMRNSFREMTNEIADTFISNADKKEEQCKSGLEKDIYKLECTISHLIEEKEKLTYILTK